MAEDEFFIAMDLEMALKAAQAIVLGPIARFQAGPDLVTRQNHISAALLEVNLGSEVVFPVADDRFPHPVIQPAK